MNWNSRALAIQIQGLHILAQRAREASKSLIQKREVLAIAYQDCLKQNLENDSILKSLSEVDRLQNSILLTNLVSSLVLRFTETLENIFNIGNIQDLSLIKKSEDENLENLVNCTFIASRYLARSQPQRTLSSTIHSLQSSLNMHAIAMRTNGVNEEDLALKSIIKLRDTLTNFFELDALESLSKQIANSWKRLIKGVKPILITSLKNNLGENFLKAAKALNVVLFDLSSRLNHIQTFIELFSSTEEPDSTATDDRLLTAKAEANDLSSSVDQKYQKYNFANSPSEIATMKEKVDATDGDLDKLIELFEKRAKP